VVTMVPKLRKTMVARVIIVCLADITAKVQGQPFLAPSVRANKPVDVKIHTVVATLAAGKADVKMNHVAVVEVRLVLAAMVVVSVMMELQGVGVWMDAVFKVLKTKTGLEVAEWQLGRATPRMMKRAVLVVGLMTANMGAVPVQMEVFVMRVFVQAVEEVLKTITGATLVVGLVVSVKIQTGTPMRTVMVMLAIELCTMLAWRGVSFTLMVGVLFVSIRGCHRYITEEYIHALYPYPLQIRAGDAYSK